MCRGDCGGHPKISHSQKIEGLTWAPQCQISTRGSKLINRVSHSQTQDCGPPPPPQTAEMAMGSQEASPVPPSDRQIGRRPEGKPTSLRPLAVQCTKRCCDSMFGVPDSKPGIRFQRIWFLKRLENLF